MSTITAPHSRARRALLAAAPLVAALGIALIAVPVAHAQTYTDTFSGTGADTNFNPTTGTFTQSGGLYSSGGGGTVAEFTRTGFTNLTNVTVSMIISSSGDSGILFATDGTAPLQNGILIDPRTSNGDLLIQQIRAGTFVTPFIQDVATPGSVSGQTIYLTVSDINNIYTGTEYNYSAATGTIGTVLGTVAYNANTNPGGYTGLRTSGDVGIFQQDTTSKFGNFTVTNAAPEPTALLLLAPGALGMVGMIARASRKRDGRRRNAA